MSVKLKLGLAFCGADPLRLQALTWEVKPVCKNTNSTLARQDVPEMMIAADSQVSVLQSASRTRNRADPGRSGGAQQGLARAQSSEKCARLTEKLEKLSGEDKDKALFRAIVDARAAYVPLKTSS